MQFLSESCITKNICWKFWKYIVKISQRALPILFLYLNNDLIWKAEIFGAVNSSAHISSPTQNTSHNSR